MSRSDWIAVIGILIAIIFGIPSVPSFAAGNLALGFVSILLFLVILALTGFLFWFVALPPWTIISHHMRVELLDPDGKDAIARKTIRLRANHGGIQHYAHRNISCDGMLTFEVDSNVSAASHVVEAGDHRVTVAFPNQIGRFKTAATWIEFKLKDTFPADTEGVIVLVDQPIKSLTIEVIYPKDRLPHSGSVRVLYRYSGKEEELSPPEIVDRQVIWTRSRRFRAIPYGEYEISWRW